MMTSHGRNMETWSLVDDPIRCCQTSYPTSWRRPRGVDRSWRRRHRGDERVDIATNVPWDSELDQYYRTVLVPVHPTHPPAIQYSWYHHHHHYRSPVVVVGDTDRVGGPRRVDGRTTIHRGHGYWFQRPIHSHPGQTSRRIPWRWYATIAIVRRTEQIR